jgi:hypothetical protein
VLEEEKRRKKKKKKKKKIARKMTETETTPQKTPSIYLNVLGERKSENLPKKKKGAQSDFLWGTHHGSCCAGVRAV